MTPEWERAVRTGDAERLEQLVGAGADVNSRDRYGQTGLMVAATRGHTEVVRCLIVHDADLNHTAKFHLSAVMLAVLNRHAEIVQLLVRAGADLTIRGTGAPGFHDKTALDLAKAHGPPDLVEALEPSVGPST